MALYASDFRADLLEAIMERLSVEEEGAFDVGFNRTLNQILVILHWCLVQFVGTFLCVAVIKVIKCIGTNRYLCTAEIQLLEVRSLALHEI